MDLTKNTTEISNIKEIEKKIETLRIISANKTRLIISANRRNNKDYSDFLEKEKMYLDEKIAKYQKHIFQILIQKKGLQAANDQDYNKSMSVLGKVKNFIGNILGKTKEEKKFKGDDTMSFLSKSNVMQSTAIMENSYKGKSFSFIGKIQFRNKENQGIQKDNFACICQYSQVLEKRNSQGFPMIALIFRDIKTNEILGRNVGFFNEKTYKETGLFLVESAAKNKVLICIGNNSHENYSNVRRIA